MRTDRRGLRAPRAIGLALTLTAASAGIGLTGEVALAPPAFAIDQGKGTPGHCPDDKGVTVVIDFQRLGGTTVVRCAPGDQATGHAALKNAGIRIAGTNRWGEAFICRIEGRPGPADESCVDTPPASAYWSYWHAPDRGKWSYSQWGVMNRKPPPGSFEGWSFSMNETETASTPPRLAPLRPTPSPAPKPKPKPKPSSGPTAGPTGDGSSSGGGSNGGGSSNGGSSQSGGSGGDHANGGSNGSTGGTGSTGSGSSSSGSSGGGGGGSADGSRPAAPSAPAKTGGKSETPSTGTTPAASEEPVPGTAVTPGEAPEWTGDGDSGTEADETTAATGAADRGIPLSTVAGLTALALLLLAAGATAWRRRRAARADDPT
ncbi:hypothetical protein GCM10010387_24250 [Streptomyces inusitatus]|uniref:Flagellar hook-length control protein FliK n=1 Tax=Streptomyces inusitatus TaxID=68221 RepID=A0A918USE4_9ACTN|nr:hypothetical protein [Streptomyces inusitatus]GGZ29948.1 hypothetical protein GCM10010387_24250 [Streptomyces inusitatus]